MRHITTGENGRVSRWVSLQMGQAADFSVCTAIGLEDDAGELVAGTVYDYFNGASINMHFAFVGGWLYRPFLHFCFWYPFEQIGVRRITALVPESNKRAIRFDEHLGFEYETRLKDAHPTGDVLIYRMFRHQCRWLNLKARYDVKALGTTYS